MSKIIISESLNELDRKTDNAYDLRSLYESVRHIDGMPQKVAELIRDGKDAKSLYEAMISYGNDGSKVKDYKDGFTVIPKFDWADKGVEAPVGKIVTSIGEAERIKARIEDDNGFQHIIIDLRNQDVALYEKAYRKHLEDELFYEGNSNRIKRKNKFEAIINEDGEQPDNEQGGGSDGFESLLHKLQKMGNYEQFIKALKGLNADQKQLFMKNFGKVDAIKPQVQEGGIAVTKLIPTQSEIDWKKSLSRGLTQDCSYFFSPPVELGMPVLTYGGKYIIDGHHRWSQVYMFNPKATVQCINFNYEQSGHLNVLKDFQAAVLAQTGNINVGTAGTNIWNVNESELQKFIDENMQDACWKSLVKAGVAKDRESAIKYIIGNAMALKNGVKPISNAPDRVDMPQTTPEVVARAKDSITDMSESIQLNEGHGNESVDDENDDVYIDNDDPYEDNWDFHKETWIDWKERQLRKKGRANWDQDDWEAWAYIENTRAETQYYDESLTEDGDCKYWKVIANTESDWAGAGKQKIGAVYLVKAKGQQVAIDAVKEKEPNAIGVVAKEIAPPDDTKMGVMAKRGRYIDTCRKNESIKGVIRQSIDEGLFIETVAEPGYEPKKKGIAYKVFKVKNGKLYPPMVANPGGADTPVGVWLKADEGEFAGLSKTGRPQVKSTQSGTLSYRPGWHLGDVPRASQFDRTNKETGEKEFPKDFVWAECEYTMDVDYQKDSDEQGYMRTKPDGTTYRSDKYQHSLAGLPRLPKDGYYKYRTNPRPDTVPWVITGAIKVKKLLDDAEVNEILKSKGIEPIHRQGGDKTLAELGLTQIKESQENIKESKYAPAEERAKVKAFVPGDKTYYPKKYSNKVPVEVRHIEESNGDNFIGKTVKEYKDNHDGGFFAVWADEPGGGFGRKGSSVYGNSDDLVIKDITKSDSGYDILHIFWNKGIKEANNETKFDELVQMLKKSNDFGREGYRKGLRAGGAFNPEFIKWVTETVPSKYHVRMYTEYNKGWVAENAANWDPETGKELYSVDSGRKIAVEPIDK